MDKFSGMNLKFVDVEIQNRDRLELFAALDNEGYPFKKSPKLPEGRPVEIKADYVAGDHKIETWINMDSEGGGRTSHAEIDISVLIDKRKKEWRSTTISYNAKDGQTAAFENAESKINKLKDELSLKNVEILRDDEWDSIVTEAINFVELCFEEGFAKALPKVEDYFGVYINPL